MLIAAASTSLCGDLVGKVTLANEMGAPIGTTREVAGTVGLTQFFAAHAEKVQFEETRPWRSGPV